MVLGTEQSDQAKSLLSIMHKHKQLCRWYIAKKMVSWLMLFDLDESSKPGENALSFKEQLISIQEKTSLLFISRTDGLVLRVESTQHPKMRFMI